MTMTTDVVVVEASLEDTTYTYDRSEGTTSKVVITSSGSFVGAIILMALLLITTMLAFIANLAMLICLLKYKQGSKKTVNIFICNQIVHDLVTAFFGTLHLALLASGYTVTKTGVLSTFMIKLSISLHNAYFILRTSLISL